MKLRVTQKSVEVLESRPNNGDYQEIEIVFTNGRSVQVSLNATDNQIAVFAQHYGMNPWLLKLFKAAEKGDWRDVDCAIKNLKVQYESSNHAARHNNPR